MKPENYNANEEISLNDLDEFEEKNNISNNDLDAFFKSSENKDDLLDDLIADGGNSKITLILGISTLILAFIPIINYLVYLLIIAVIFFTAKSIKNDSKKIMAIIGIIITLIAIPITINSQKKWNKIIYKSINSVMTKLKLSDNEQKIENSNSQSNYQNNDILKEIKIDIGTFNASVDELGFIDSKLEITITNNSNQEKNFNIEIGAFDSNNNQIASDINYVDNLKPKEVRIVNLFTEIDNNYLEHLNHANFKIVNIQ